MLLKFPDYSMFQYEREFAEKEVQLLFPQVSYSVSPEGIFLNIQKDSSYLNNLKKLTYIKSIPWGNGEEITYQALKEASCPKVGSHKKQSTRYGAHGLHEYKGKFNPQIVSSIINLCGIKENDKILEPFCGSGTTLYEAMLNGICSEGFDYNPLACFLSNAKLSTVKISGDELIRYSDLVITQCRKKYNDVVIKIDERSEYLSRWLDQNYFKIFECLLQLSKVLIDNNDIRNVFLCVCSNNLREYSLQEPADLRIRRRTSPYPDIDVLTKINNTVSEIALSINAIKRVCHFDNVHISSRAHNIDIRDTESLLDYKEYSAAITSPPYATALPYIDTQRLSLIWLGLSSPKQVKELENNLIGSRELTKKEEKLLRLELEQNTKEINIELHKLCNNMLNSLGSDDGFRRQAMPFIVYRYFSDMQLMFKNVWAMLKSSGTFALVVGHNQTTLGGKLFNLDTPTYLKMIAEENGFSSVDDIKLDVYKRYDLHKANSINSERLIILKKVD
ncbi:DNA methyltransferase [Xenorhabdus thuongxuanensis]|uniref:Ribosomal RNA large subunit methyltransferase K/L-like methyltransferase domain-containing protein n=1 Tax=Xenorhabdus thuongxuanensis TaxID=1873484 RepID=A0A1Q5U337_9GAMM|nr:DNA methyltransferase [Xenorhabdus thuongxuanensis]OKP06835.1 hypothetical protein Xentx_01741 [Xenorhabdus thuongxuanensis]